MPQKKTGKTPAARWTPPNSQADDAPMTAEDYLALADEAPSVKKRLEYIKKALELEPDNLSAQLMEAIEEDDLLKMISLSEQMIAQEEASLRDQGYFKKECIGDFWLIWETRDYMRMRIKHLGMLTMIHRLRAAVAEAKDLLRLCTGDNVGARYILMGLYVALEEKDELEKLLGQYDEAGPETLFALLAKDDTIRNNMKHFPAFDATGFRKCQITAIPNLDASSIGTSITASVQSA